jgi:glycerol-3-phosphate dehydrogenase
MNNKQTVAVIGGGINGICTAHHLAAAGYRVELFERGKLMAETSSASSKLLHGGLRYLEDFHFSLVKESLSERAWWLANCPQFAKPLQINIPVYRDSRRPGWQIGLGLSLYDFLSGSKNIGGHQRYDRLSFAAANPQLRTDNLVAGFTFFDGQMDDYHLGMWMADRARQQGVLIHENEPVLNIDAGAKIALRKGERSFDFVVNVAGPWAEQLLQQSNIVPARKLSLIRGSHLLLPETCQQAYLLESPGERRVFFVLPWQGKTLVGTTECEHDIAQPATATPEEVRYLLDAYNHYFNTPARESDILSTFSGIRPLLESGKDPTRASREYAIVTQDRLVSVFGGKWTTARALAQKVVKKVTSIG